MEPVPVYESMVMVGEMRMESRAIKVVKLFDKEPYDKDDVPIVSLIFPLRTEICLGDKFILTLTRFVGDNDR